MKYYRIEIKFSDGDKLDFISCFKNKEHALNVVNEAYFGTIKIELTELQGDAE